MQVPFELTGSPSVNVTVTTAGGGSTTVSSLPLQPLFPGIFETTAFGQRQVVATHDNGSFVSPSNPVRKGENITVFLTGLGQTTPALFTNSPGVPGQRVNAIVTPFSTLRVPPPAKLAGSSFARLSSWLRDKHGDLFS